MTQRHLQHALFFARRVAPWPGVVAQESAQVLLSQLARDVGVEGRERISRRVARESKHGFVHHRHGQLCRSHRRAFGIVGGQRNAHLGSRLHHHLGGRRRELQALRFAVDVQNHAAVGCAGKEPREVFGIGQKARHGGRDVQRGRVLGTHGHVDQCVFGRDFHHAVFAHVITGEGEPRLGRPHRAVQHQLGDRAGRVAFSIGDELHALLSQGAGLLARSADPDVELGVAGPAFGIVNACEQLVRAGVFWGEGAALGAARGLERAGLRVDDAACGHAAARGLRNLHELRFHVEAGDVAARMVHADELHHELAVHFAEGLGLA
jgi:hypothetical protein